jgi:rod shape determining protein RodA
MYTIEKSTGINFLKQFDYLLFILVISLSVFGIIVLGSATNSMSDGPKMMKTQIISLIIGLVLIIIINILDYKIFRILGLLFFIATTFLLVYVLIKGIGERSWGSRSWISIPVFGSMQPSELAKIAFILTTAIFLERLKENSQIRDAVKLILYSALPIGLILLQPDYGTAIVFIFIFSVMLYVFGIRYRYIMISLGAMIFSLPFIWFFLLNDERKNRIREFLFPGFDPLGASYQVDRAKMAIGSGRLFGSGLYNGMQTQNASVPVFESDLIFTVIGEELGFIGTMIIVILSFAILLRCIHIARNSRDTFGSLIVCGVIGMLGFNFIENIGMCIGLLPVTGLPLPFISAGGSAMLTNCIAIGLVMSVSMRRKKSIFNSQN